MKNFPEIGDYVVATKYTDGDPHDPWAIGFYQGTNDRGRCIVHDSDGKSIYSSGYSRIKKISGEKGKWLLDNHELVRLSGFSVYHFVRLSMATLDSAPKIVQPTNDMNTPNDPLIPPCDSSCPSIPNDKDDDPIPSLEVTKAYIKRFNEREAYEAKLRAELQRLKEENGRLKKQYENRTPTPWAFEQACRALEKRHDELRVWKAIAESMAEGLRMSLLGGCTCMTKTPEVKFHDSSCRYRKLSEILSSYQELIKGESK